MIGYSIEPGGEFAIYKRPNKKFKALLSERLKNVYGPGYYMRIMKHKECVREIEFCERLLKKEQEDK